MTKGSRRISIQKNIKFQHARKLDLYDIKFNESFLISTSQRKEKSDSTRSLNSKEHMHSTVPPAASDTKSLNDISYERIAIIIFINCDNNE